MADLLRASCRSQAALAGASLLLIVMGIMVYAGVFQRLATLFPAVI